MTFPTSTHTESFICAACGRPHDAFISAMTCCLKRGDKDVRPKVSQDTHCKTCGRFVPASFGCDCPSKPEPKRAGYFREHYEANREKKIAAALARHYERRLFA
jgi:hypothetical protein